jgi:hypothetical protein
MVLPSIKASFGSFVGQEGAAKRDGRMSAGAVALMAGERVESLETLTAAGMGRVLWSWGGSIKIHCSLVY